MLLVFPYVEEEVCADFRWSSIKSVDNSLPVLHTKHLAQVTTTLTLQVFFIRGVKTWPVTGCSAADVQMGAV